MRVRACTNVRTSRRHSRHSLLFSDKLTLHLQDQLLRMIRNVLRYETGQRRQLSCGIGDSHMPQTTPTNAHKGQPPATSACSAAEYRELGGDGARWSPSRCHSGYGPPRRCGPPRIDYASEYGPTSADTVRHSGYDSKYDLAAR